ncbi:MAG: FAD-dependent oxidoreductase [Acidobacteriota bacterium]
MTTTTPRPLLVVGAGIAGVTAALEAAEAGREVVLVEKEAFVGGRVLRSHHYFPKLCPPSCGMEINTRRLDRNPRVRVLTGATVSAAAEIPGGWRVTIAHAPKYVNARCTACGACSEACPAQVPDPFNLGMARVPAIRLPHVNAWPKRFTLDRSACPTGCRACVEACAYDAIDLDAAASTETIEVGAVVVATGWKPYPLEKLAELGGGVFPDVIANVQMERLAAPAGPTGGKILRPSDGQAPKRVAFVQCAGSRDVNHLPYCSAVCCLASLKQAIYVHEQLPDAEVTIYYIDRRTPGRNEDMLTRVAAIEGVRLVKGKVGKIEKAASGSLALRVEEVESGRLVSAEADLVVLATGMVPCLREEAVPGAALDADGFGLDSAPSRMIVAGVARRPEDVAASVRDATGAAARACVAAGRA